MTLRGRAVLVTGVGRRAGIGFAIARRLAGAGADLLIQSWPAYDRSTFPDEAPCVAKDLVDELRTAGGRVEHVEADFLDPDAPARTLAHGVERFGHLDALVANHAHSTSQPLAELRADEIDRHLLVNVRASLLLVQAFAAQHDGRPGGRVVLLTSGQGLGPMAGELAYAASKGALAQLVPSLAEALATRGVTVNAVNPGPTDTGWVDPRLRQQLLPRMPFGRLGQPDDAARLVGWLLSDDAAWITGQVIHSEGGFRRG